MSLIGFIKLKYIIHPKRVDYTNAERNSAKVVAIFGSGWMLCLICRRIVKLRIFFHFFCPSELYFILWITREILHNMKFRSWPHHREIWKVAYFFGAEVSSPNRSATSSTQWPRDSPFRAASGTGSSSWTCIIALVAVSTKLGQSISRASGRGRGSANFVLEDFVTRGDNLQQ